MQTVIRNSREYAAMAEAELATESEISLEAADEATNSMPDWWSVGHMNAARAILVGRATVYARLAQMAAIHEAEAG